MEFCDHNNELYLICLLFMPCSLKIRMNIFHFCYFSFLSYCSSMCNHFLLRECFIKDATNCSMSGYLCSTFMYKVFCVRIAQLRGYQKILVRSFLTINPPCPLIYLWPLLLASGILYPNISGLPHFQTVLPLLFSPSWIDVFEFELFILIFISIYFSCSIYKKIILPGFEF